MCRSLVVPEHATAPLRSVSYASARYAEWARARDSQWLWLGCHILGVVFGVGGVRPDGQGIAETWKPDTTVAPASGPLRLSAV